MTNPQLAGLTAEENENYHAVCELLEISSNRSIPDMDFLTDQKSALESLSACRALLKDAKLYLQSYEMASEREGFKGTSHHDGIKKMIVAIAAELAGTGE